MTFQVQSPEDLDPEEKDPNMAWAVKAIPGIGCGNKIVARIMLQSQEFVKLVIHSEKEKNLIMDNLRQCKELLLACSEVSEVLQMDVQRIIDQIGRGEISFDKRNRVFNPFPHVTDLENKCIRFLTGAKLFLQKLAEVFGQFYGAAFDGPHYHKIRDLLRDKFDEHHRFYNWVKDNEPAIKHIVNLRNAQEHPTANNKLAISNFIVEAGNVIKPPIWELSNCNAQRIDEEMAAITTFLLEFGELLVILCAISSDKLSFPYQIAIIPEAEQKKECPMFYKPYLDIKLLMSNGAPKAIE